MKLKLKCTVLLSYLLFLPCLTVAQNQSTIPSWNGFSASDSEVQGIRLENKGVGYSSAVVAEIDGIVENGKEIAVGGSDGYVYVYKADGTLHWSHRMPNAGCTKTGATNKLYSSPAVGDLYGDGEAYVVIGYGGPSGADCGGGVAILRGPQTDAELAAAGMSRRRGHLSTRRFTRKNRIWAQLYGVFGSPTLADVNGDGVMEIGIGSFDRGVYLLNARGRVIWRYNAADTVWGSPIFYNLVPERKRQRLEMFIATDISKNTYFDPPTPDGGVFYALKAGRRVKSITSRKWRRPKFRDIGFRDKKHIVWQTDFNQVLFSSPVLADLLPEREGLELAIASGCYFGDGNNKRGKWIKIVDAETGEIVKTLNTHACSPSSVAVGDIDEDGRLEIVATVNGHEDVGGDGSSRIAAYNPEDSDPFWETIPRDKYGNYPWGGHFMSPVIADLDGNGSLEVIAPNSRSLGVYDGKTGAALTCQRGSCDGETFFRTGSALFSTPVVADIDGDGLPELLTGSAKNNRGGLFGWTDLQSSLASTPGTHEPYFAPWPTHRGDALRSGIYWADLAE